MSLTLASPPLPPICPMCEAEAQFYDPWTDVATCALCKYRHRRGNKPLAKPAEGP